MQVNGCEIHFQIDTAADVNTLCQRYVRKQQVKLTNQKLTMWNETKFEPVGEVILLMKNPKN